MYEIFEHTADLGMRVQAESREALFAEAARGFCAMLVTNPDAVRAERQIDFQVKGADLDYLLLDWLNELLFAFESQDLLLCEFDVQLDEQGLTAQAQGETIDPARHQLDHEVKAITYHGLKVEQTGDHWQAEVIVDI